jgi:tetratricopeptide (TPR) repeat protein
MNVHTRSILFVCLVLLAVPASNAQTFTMNKDCRAQVAAAEASNMSGDHAGALAAFDALVDKCKTKDAREVIQVGRAVAYNGLGQYGEALAAADQALAVTGNTSLNAYFEKSYAEEKSGQLDQATADMNRIIELTEKNKNVADRATVYAKVADLNYRTGKFAEADSYLAKAMELDPQNARFHLQKGDWAVAAGNYDQAFQEFDKAVAMGTAGPQTYQMRAEARLKMVQEKYGTTDTGELRKKMTPAERDMVCGEMKKALDLGLKDMKMDMFSALVCR